MLEKINLKNRCGRYAGTNLQYSPIVGLIAHNSRLVTTITFSVLDLSVQELAFAPSRIVFFFFLIKFFRYDPF